MSKSIFTFLFICIVYVAKAQVGIGTTTVDGSAILDLTSNAKGLLVPRMTAAQRTAISNPATGLVVYQTDGQQGIYINSGNPGTPNWAPMVTVAPGTSGNVLTSNGTDWVSQAAAGGSGTVTPAVNTTLAPAITITTTNTLTDIASFSVSKASLVNVRVQFGASETGARNLLVTDNSNNVIAVISFNLNTSPGINGVLGLSVFVESAGAYKIRASSSVTGSVVSSYSVSKIEFN
jgi:hypothetical protein